MEKFIKNYWPPLLLGVIGLFLAILLITVGFFKTLLLLFITALGVTLGWYLQREGILKQD